MIKDITTMPYQCIPAYDVLSRVNEINVWCQTNCTGEWQLGHHWPGYGATPPTWYFMCQADWLAFRLRWT